jgi:hypothetical protein
MRLARQLAEAKSSYYSSRDLERKQCERDWSAAMRCRIFESGRPRGFEKFNRIPVGILQLDLLAARSHLHVIAKAHFATRPRQHSLHVICLQVVLLTHPAKRAGKP